MNAGKIRKNFVFDEETVKKLEKLKNANNKSATKIVQDLIAQSFKVIKQEERKKAIAEYLKTSKETAKMMAEFGDEYKNATVQSIKTEMGVRYL